MRLGSGTAARSTVVLAAVLVPVGIAALIGMVALWPGAPRAAAREITEVGVTYPTAEVTSTEESSCTGTTENRLPDGTIPTTVPCLRVHATVTSGPATGRPIAIWATAMLTAQDVPRGTSIVVEHYPASGQDPEVWAWHDFARSFPLATLALAFAAVTIAVARMRGLRALVGLAIAFGVVGTFILPGLLAGENPLLVGLVGSTVIMYAVLYLAHGFSRRSSTALVGTVAGLAVTAGLGVVAAAAAHVTGVSSEDSYRLATMIGADGADQLRGLFLCGVVLAGLGVLNDVTITQASAVWELRSSAPEASRRVLFSRAMRIGRDHIASTVYTIAFAYAGASLPILLLVQVYRLSLVQTLTSGQFAEEIVRTLVGSIGLVLAIPLTTAIATLVATSEPVSTRRRHRVAEPLSHAHH